MQNSADLEALVERFRQGDDSVKSALIEHHFADMKSVANWVAFNSRRYDLLEDLHQQAIEEMITAINDSRAKLVNNQITAFLKTTVTHRLCDYVATNRNVHMPGRTYRQKKALADGGLIRGAPKEFAFAEADSEAILTAPPEDTSFEFEEAMNLAARTEQEQRIVKLRLAGYKYRECAELIGIKIWEVTAIIKRIRRRFEAYWQD